jgi:hypothetical protein
MHGWIGSAGIRWQRGLCLAALFLGVSAPADEPLTFPSADGTRRAPLALGDGQLASVLIFVSPFCPTSNNFLPEVNAIAADHGARFAFHLVEAEPGLQLPDVLRHIEISGISIPVLLDPDLRLTRLAGATVTPEAVVLAADGRPLYRGRINDFYLTPTRKQRQATTRDLRDALEAIAEGRPVPAPQPPAVGCKISGLAPP